MLVVRKSEKLQCAAFSDMNLGMCPKALSGGCFSIFVKTLFISFVPSLELCQCINKSPFNCRQAQIATQIIADAINPPQCPQIPLTISKCLCAAGVVLLLSGASLLTFLPRTPSGCTHRKLGTPGSVHPLQGGPKLMVQDN